MHALNSAIAKVNAAKGLGSGQPMLAAYLGTDITPLQQLDQKIQGDTTVKQAAQDFSTIFSAYRVYVLVLPASRIAADADRVTSTALPTLTAASSKAQGLVNPQNHAQLQPLIDDLNAQISAASPATNGLAGTVLAFSPAQWNANHDVLSPARSSDQTAACRSGEGSVGPAGDPPAAQGLVGRGRGRRRLQPPGLWPPRHDVHLDHNHADHGRLSGGATPAPLEVPTGAPS